TALDLPERFLLQLGSFFPHKNLEASIEGFARSGARSGDTALVLAGGGGSDEYRASLMERVERHGLGDRVRWIDHVPAEHLAPLVSAARAVLMPSRYEGYGMPILEAMAAGTAGVASTSTCLPEVSAGIWDACDPDDADAWALAIDRLVGEESAHDATVERGLAHAATRTWDECARRTATFLKTAAESA
ncbi:MAG: glycosyltransferase, partial [Planctomycetota bacterium]